MIALEQIGDRLQTGRAAVTTVWPAQPSSVA